MEGSCIGEINHLRFGVEYSLSLAVCRLRARDHRLNCVGADIFHQTLRLIVDFLELANL